MRPQKPISRSVGAPEPNDWEELRSKPGITVKDIAYIVPGVPEKKGRK